LLAKGEFALLTQDLTIAQGKPGQPVKRGTMAHDHHLFMLLADAAAQQRDEQALRQYTPRLEELATRDGHQLYLGIAHRAWGIAHRLAGEHDQAATRLVQALDLFRGMDTRWQIGRTYFEIGELDLARGDREAAREQFSLALEAFEALGAMPAVARARAALEKFSESRPLL
jgi:tetratricopeptide (TPR) repeat protein